jgi:hypothetical protein
LQRKSEGVKLGKVVYKDFSKLVTTRKPSQRTQHISCIINHRLLTDQGLREVVPGLVEVLSNLGHPEGPTAVLEVLHLRDNRLTASSLAQLADIVELAASDIVDIDLSSNAVVVTNPKEVIDFAKFLQSLAKCSTLRKLNLSLNDFSGPLALETFARGYFNYAIDSRSDLANEGVPASSGGLHSVPYILFENCSFDDASALFLSDIVRVHPLPESLTVPVASPIANIIEDECRSKYPTGLHYSVDNLTQYGNKLMNGAEDERRALHKAMEGFEICDDMLEEHNGSFAKPKRRVIARRATLTEQLDSYKKKLQRETIESRGATSVQLWSAALKSLTISRILLAQTEQHDDQKSFYHERDKLPSFFLNNQMKLRSKIMNHVLQAYDGRLPRSLPRKIIHRIAYDAYADPCRVLTSEQKIRILDYAKDRNSLKAMEELKDKSRSFQIWMILDKLQCLEYS